MLFYLAVASAANGEPHTMSAKSSRPRSKQVRIVALGQTSEFVKDLIFNNTVTIRMQPTARCLGNWLPCNVWRVRFPQGTSHCVLRKLLFWVWGSCVCETLCL